MGLLSRRVAEAVGVSIQFAQLVRMGRRADAETNARHARFAAALAVNDLMSECSVTDVVAKWGVPNFVSTGGALAAALVALQLRVFMQRRVMAVYLNYGGCHALLSKD
jgi:hypothetical protein